MHILLWPLTLLLSLLLTTSAQVRQTPDPVHGCAFAVAGSNLFVQGGKTELFNTTATTSSQLFALDLSIGWSVNQAPWTSLELRETGSLIHAIASPDNATLYIFTRGLNDSIVIPRYNIKHNIWDDPLKFLPDGDSRQGYRPVIDPNTWKVYINAYWNENVINLNTSTIGNVPRPFTSNFFGGASFIRSRNSIMYFGGLNGKIQFDPPPTTVTEFSVSTGSWTNFTTTGEPPSPRADFCMASSEDGKTVVIFGGRVEPSTIVAPKPDALFTGTIYILDVATGKWTRGPDGDIRGYMACVIVGDQLVVWGGSNGTYTKTGPPVIFNLKTQQWVETYTPPAYMIKSTSSSTSGSGATATDISSGSGSSSNLGGILGGVFGGLFVVALSGLLYLYVKRREDRIRYGVSSSQQGPKQQGPNGKTDNDLQNRNPQTAIRDPQDVSNSRVIFSSPIDSEMEYTVSRKQMSDAPTGPSSQQPIVFNPMVPYPSTVGGHVPIPFPAPPYDPSRDNVLTDLSGDVFAGYNAPSLAGATANLSSTYGTQPLQGYTQGYTSYPQPPMGVTAPYVNHASIPPNITAEPVATAVNPSYIHPGVRSRPIVPTEPAPIGLVYVPPLLNQTTAASSPPPASEASINNSNGSQGSPQTPPLPQRPVQNNNLQYSSVVSGPLDQATPS
ncbi:hypothetical protein BGZ65_002892 [Modicella reniformis]|uniref:Galactose oxidase n=1 Tax=Modicella reniformis TaxID=1440133 RepID=A0A9P6MIG1_9FUNG|nr:hypothetical protein BGZ65_002892 [Modicella reniformis]